MEEIPIPFNFKPRRYQVPFLREMDRGFKRAVLVWHRRAGKDKTLINFVVKRMLERKGMYFYFFPTYTQGKKILWDGMDREGFRFMEHIPAPLRRKTDNTTMQIELVNGSIFQIIGTENIDSVVGTNPIGCVFSEYALQDPRAWDYIRPILAENNGWAVFNFTPRGNNHGKEIFELAKKSDSWFCQMLTVEDTQAIPKKVLDQEREEIMARDGSDALYLQEYMCSFDAPIPGAYFAQQMVKAKDDGRIGKVPYDTALNVDTYWDLGVGDATAIWFCQRFQKEVRLIDYYEAQGEGLPHYKKVLDNKGYTYGEHWAPHDIEVSELGTGKSRKETASGLGIKFRVAPRLPLDDGIEAARNLLSLCWFDEDRCTRGLDALRSYHKEYDDKKQTYRDRPNHDWASHGADAFRTMAIAFRERPPDTPKQDFSKWQIG